MLLLSLTIHVIYFEWVHLFLNIVRLFYRVVEITHVLKKLCFQNFDLVLHIGHLSLSEILKDDVLGSPDIRGILMLLV